MSHFLCLVYYHFQYVVTSADFYARQQNALRVFAWLEIYLDSFRMTFFSIECTFLRIYK